MAAEGRVKLLRFELVGTPGTKSPLVNAAFGKIVIMLVMIDLMILESNDHKLEQIVVSTLESV